MLLNLIILCIPFSFPSLYLAYRLYRKRFLGSIFNQHVALMMIFSGLIIPFNLGSCLLRLLIFVCPDLEGYEIFIPSLCVSLSHLQSVWVAPAYYMSINAILFRFAIVKYADRGLANDRYYYNMNMRLFNILFWTSNTFLLMLNQSRVWSFFLENGESFFSNTHRTLLCLRAENLPPEALSHKIYDNPNTRRDVNLYLKAIPLFMAGICSLGISWKKRKLTGLFMKLTGQQNVMTLNQTLLMVFLIMVDNTLPYYFMETRKEYEFILEMSRTILFEIIFLKFLIPIILIINSKHNLPELWLESNPRTLPFFMTTPSLVPRSEFSQLQDQRELQRKGRARNFKKMGNYVVRNIQNEVASVSMPTVSD